MPAKGREIQPAEVHGRDVRNLDEAPNFEIPVSVGDDDVGYGEQNEIIENSEKEIKSRIELFPRKTSTLKCLLSEGRAPSDEDDPNQGRSSSLPEARIAGPKGT